jgi:ABC-type transport system involved in Fe-S cluster assembly fused permease/ATPase subunit
MTDEFKLLRDRQRAAQAKVLTEDEILKGAFSALKTQYVTQLLNTPVDQHQARETLYFAHRALIEVERHLMQVIEDGKLADAELKALERLAQPKQRWQDI